MNEHWNLLYKKLLTDIEECRDKSLSEKDQIECAFKTSTIYWENIKKQLAGYEFENIKDEINFYKNIKPKFTSHIEYFTMLYQSLLFIPSLEGDEFKKAYWEHEQKRLKRFVDKNFQFVNYYSNGQTNMDLQYFVAANYDLGNLSVAKAYNMDGEFISSHDHLVASLFAQAMYYDYVKGKLAELV